MLPSPKFSVQHVVIERMALTRPYSAIRAKLVYDSVCPTCCFLRGNNILLTSCGIKRSGRNSKGIRQNKKRENTPPIDKDNEKLRIEFPVWTSSVFCDGHRFTFLTEKEVTLPLRERPLSACWGHPVSWRGTKGLPVNRENKTINTETISGWLSTTDLDVVWVS